MLISHHILSANVLFRKVQNELCYHPNEDNNVHCSNFWTQLSRKLLLPLFSSLQLLLLLPDAVKKFVLWLIVFALDLFLWKLYNLFKNVSNFQETLRVSFEICFLWVSFFIILRSNVKAVTYVLYTRGSRYNTRKCLRGNFGLHIQVETFTGFSTAKY